MLMRVREETYWQWADAQLHSRSHDEVLSDGTTLDVQVRLSRLGATQLFFGVVCRGWAGIAGGVLPSAARGDHDPRPGVGRRPCPCDGYRGLAIAAKPPPAAPGMKKPGLCGPGWLRVRTLS